MQISHEKHGEKGRFVAGDGEAGAEMTYVHVGKTIVIFDHTFVPEAMRGQGIAAELVAAGVAWARQEGLKVIPQCPFARAEFERNPDYRDVLKQ